MIVKRFVICSVLAISGMACEESEEAVCSPSSSPSGTSLGSYETPAGTYLQFILPDGASGFASEGKLYMNANGNVTDSHGYLLFPAITLNLAGTSLEVDVSGSIYQVVPPDTTPLLVGQISGYDQLGALIERCPGIKAQTSLGPEPEALIFHAGDTGDFIFTAE